MKRNALTGLLAGILMTCFLLGSMSVLPLTAGATQAAEPPKAQAASLENITITIFWPPSPAYVNDEQFKLMADAGITEVFGAGNGCDSVEIQAKMIELAGKYGMTMTVSDGTFGGAVLNLSPEEIMANVEKYADNPVVSGFHLMDEPRNPNVFLNAYKAIRDAAPHLDGHINFLPFYVYSAESTKAYRQQLSDWASLTNAVSDTPTVLMYDLYPFTDNGGPFDYHAFFANLDAVRLEGLRGGNPTGLYLQSVSIPGNYRTPSASEIRYEFYAALAFGFKKFSYFTWFTPVGQNEHFENGIISPDGVPNEHYAYVSEINHEALALGTVLAKCDAVDVYMTQTAYNYYKHTQLLPGNYIVSIPKGGNADMILSRLVHKETGRNYLMLVNNDFTAEHSLTFTVSDDITGLEVVSKTDGSLFPLEGENGTYTVTLAAGDGILLALPEDYICPEDMERANASLEGVNLAASAKITASSSTGQDGWYVSNMTDGVTSPLRQKDEHKGWQSQADANPVLTLDFGEPIALNTVNLYAAGGTVDGNFGAYMPIDTAVSVSTDGIGWTDVTAAVGYNHATAASQGDPLCMNLDGAVGRYLRLTVNKANTDGNGNPLTQIGEIEVFGTPAANKSALASLIKKYTRFGGDTNADLYVSATAAMQDASSRQGYVDFLTKQMTAPVAELEAGFVEPPAEEDTTAKKDTAAVEGCASALGVSAVALTVTVAAAVALKKKEQ